MNYLDFLSESGQYLFGQLVHGIKKGINRNNKDIEKAQVSNIGS